MKTIPPERRMIHTRTGNLVSRTFTYHVDVYKTLLLPRAYGTLIKWNSDTCDTSPWLLKS